MLLHIAKATVMPALTTLTVADWNTDEHVRPDGTVEVKPFRVIDALSALFAGSGESMKTLNLEGLLSLDDDPYPLFRELAHLTSLQLAELHHVDQILDMITSEVLCPNITSLSLVDCIYHPPTFSLLKRLVEQTKESRQVIQRFFIKDKAGVLTDEDNLWFCDRVPDFKYEGPEWM